MTTKQETFFKVQREQSTIRARLGEIRAIPETDRTTEVRAERETLETRQTAVEGEFQTALDSVQSEQQNGVPVVDAEARELAVLTDKANVGDILSAVFEKRQTSGEASELQKHYGLGAHQVPLEMLRINRSVEEQRAAASVPASVGDAVQAEVVTPVFSTGDGAFLGIERPTVPVGDAAFPVLTTAPTIRGPFSNSSDAAQTDASFTANSLSPERLQASFSYRRSDMARFAGLDSSLRLALNGGLQEALDQQAINGDDGLLNGSNLSNHNVTATTTFALYIKDLLYGRVDGRYARTAADVRILVGQSAFSHASSVYKASETDETAAERLAARSGGVMVSPHVPGISSKRQNTLMRLGMERGAATQPTWEGVSLIVDEFTRATQGEVVVHAVLLANFAITRSAQWYKRQIQIP